RWRRNYYCPGAGVQFHLARFRCVGADSPGGGYILVDDYLYLGQRGPRASAPRRGALADFCLDDGRDPDRLGCWRTDGRGYLRTELAEDHRCLCLGHRPADDPGSQTQGQPNRSRKARVDLGRQRDRLGVGDLRGRWWLVDRTVPDLA